MKYHFSLLFLAVLATSCSVEEMGSPELESNGNVEFYAAIDEQLDADTKVYADSQLRVLWNEDDRVTIFNKNTYNQQYRFTGEDGDNAGAFRIVPSDDLIMGGDIDKIYAVYPYRESTKITYDGIITTAMPSEQTYKENSFGIGSNTMTAMADGNMLKFKNVGGYLSLKFYGEGVSVSSIKLKSNNGELIAGECKVNMSSGLPESSMVTSNATDEITMTCESPVELGATAEDAVQFIFVLSPVTMTGGFTVTVTTPDGGVFEKSSNRERVIGRSAITPLGAMEVVPEYADNIVFADPEVKRICVENWDTDGNGELSYEEAAAVTDLNQVFKDNHLITTFDELQYFTGLTCIDNWSFEFCTELTSVIIPEGVISMGPAGVFAYCYKLKSIKIPASLVNLGLEVESEVYLNGYADLQGPFLSCNSLESIIVSPDNPKYDSRDDCNAIIQTEQNKLLIGCKKTFIPNGVEIIGEYSLGGDAVVFDASSTMIIPNSVTSIRERAFCRQSNLISIDIPESVTSIGYGAFSGCSGLTEIIIPDSVTSIESSVFSDCSGLTSITLPESVTSIGYGAFSGCSGLTEITIPESVTSIESYVFYGCSGLTGITIPESVTSIGSSAFSGCSGLTEITIPESVTSIGHAAFNDCSSLNSLVCLANTPPSGVDSYTFRGSGLVIYVPAISVDVYKTTSGWAIYSNIIQAIPNNIVFADPEVKRLCVENWDTDGDGELDMDEAAAVTDIGNVFSENSLITSFDEFKLFTGLTSIDGSAYKLDGEWVQGGFFNCRNLTVVTLPNTITSISYSAFYNCQSLVSLYIPSAIASIPQAGYWNVIMSHFCFVGCTSLSSIIVSQDNMVYDSRDDCNAIIETATNKLIMGCKNTIIPNTVEIIGNSALGGDPYNTYDFPDSIVIPDSVKEIYAYAFSYRTNLSSVMCLAENPPVLDDTAFESTNDCPIYVPAESVDAYKTASGWSNYADRIQAIPN